MRSALATPICTRLKVKMDMKVGKRSAPSSPINDTTLPSEISPARQRSSEWSNPAAQAKLNASIGQ
jgi:hypothetical protein